MLPRIQHYSSAERTLQFSVEFWSANKDLPHKFQNALFSHCNFSGMSLEMMPQQNIYLIKNINPSELSNLKTFFSNHGCSKIGWDDFISPLPKDVIVLHSSGQPVMRPTLHHYSLPEKTLYFTAEFYSADWSLALYFQNALFARCNVSDMLFKFNKQESIYSIKNINTGGLLSLKTCFLNYHCSEASWANFISSIEASSGLRTSLHGTDEPKNIFNIPYDILQDQFASLFTFREILLIMRTSKKFKTHMLDFNNLNAKYFPTEKAQIEDKDDDETCFRKNIAKYSYKNYDTKRLIFYFKEGNLAEIKKQKVGLYQSQLLHGHGNHGHPTRVDSFLDHAYHSKHQHVLTYFFEMIRSQFSFRNITADKFEGKGFLAWAVICWQEIETIQQIVESGTTDALIKEAFIEAVTRGYTKAALDLSKFPHIEINDRIDYDYNELLHDDSARLMLFRALTLGHDEIVIGLCELPGVSLIDQWNWSNDILNEAVNLNNINIVKYLVNHPAHYKFLYKRYETNGYEKQASHASGAFYTALRLGFLDIAKLIISKETTTLYSSQFTKAIFIAKENDVSIKYICSIIAKNPHPYWGDVLHKLAYNGNFSMVKYLCDAGVSWGDYDPNINYGFYSKLDHYDKGDKKNHPEISPYLQKSAICQKIYNLSQEYHLTLQEELIDKMNKINSNPNEKITTHNYISILNRVLDLPETELKSDLDKALKKDDSLFACYKKLNIMSVLTQIVNPQTQGQSIPDKLLNFKNALQEADQALSIHRTKAWKRYAAIAISLLSVVGIIFQAAYSYYKYGTPCFWDPRGKFLLTKMNHELNTVTKQKPLTLML